MESISTDPGTGIRGARSRKLDSVGSSLLRLSHSYHVGQHGWSSMAGKANLARKWVAISSPEAECLAGGEPKRGW